MINDKLWLIPLWYVLMMWFDINIILECRNIYYEALLLVISEFWLSIAKNYEWYNN